MLPWIFLLEGVDRLRTQKVAGCRKEAVCCAAVGWVRACKLSMLPKASLVEDTAGYRGSQHPTNIYYRTPHF